MPAEPAPTADPSEELDARSIRLMRRVKEGDDGAFRELVELHQDRVIGTCARMLGNVDEAHDVAQQVFLRVWRAAPRYEPTAKFTTWLITILRHLVFNETRRRSRHPTVSLEASLFDRSAVRRDVVDAAAKSPDDVSLQAELERAIDQAIQALPDQQRLAVTLRGYQDMGYEEIAEVLQTSVSAVKSLLFRARAQLRGSLREYLDG